MITADDIKTTLRDTRSMMMGIVTTISLSRLPNQGAPSVALFSNDLKEFFVNEHRYDEVGFTPE